MKRLCMLLLVFALCSGLFALPAGAAFDDITDRETQTAAALLQNLGIVAGYGDGKFHPGDNLTRAQFCKMLVLLSGVRDVAAYEGFTIFPDVRANHWGRGYINTAARALKAITGFPDGTFKPNIPISYAQAVTTVMRLLEYTDSDVGLTWPRGYLDKAKQIGLTAGIGLGDSDNITRGLGARLFYNAIFTTNKSGKKYCDVLGFKEQKVIVLRKDGTGPDGLSRGLVTIGGDNFYPYRSQLDIEEGSQGTLLVDGEGFALSWAPDKQTAREITVAAIGPMSVTGPDGDKVNNIPSSALVYINGEENTWGKCWIDISPGLALRFYFNAAGAIDYIFLFQPTDEGDVKIIGTEHSSGHNPLPALGIDPDARVSKNGVATSWASLRVDDVLTYNPVANTVNATDFRITGIYESALPSREAPDEVITLGGSSFKVLPDVRLKLAASKTGDAMTFFFTTDGRVADVRPVKAPVFQPGITTGDRSVMLYNGMVISGDAQLSGSFREGTPVLACMPEPGKLRLEYVPSKGSVGLDIVNMKAGAADIAPYAVFFDLSGIGGRAIRVPWASLPDVVEAKNVLSVAFETGNRANLIVLRNVTGDALQYGFTSVVPGSLEAFDIKDENGVVVDTVYNRTPSQLNIDNHNGRQTFEDPQNRGRNSGGSVYGVSIGTNGYVLSSQACVRVNNVLRSAFSGNAALTVSGVLRPIPEGLTVYVQATKEYVSIADARLYSNNFTVFLDKPAAEGGKPRFIIAL